MRDLRKNRVPIYYSLRNIDVKEDEWGNEIDVKGYDGLLFTEMSISADKGQATAQSFGADLQYDREMCTHDMTCPIDEYTRLWIDGRAITDTHNYVVVAKSVSLNCIRYAIRRVEVS
jgi:hypothetical protein